MVVVRNWREQAPRVSHLSAIIWDMFIEKGWEGRPPEQTVLGGFFSLTLHMMQSGKEGDYHAHEGMEQVYYFTKGRGKMKIAEKVYDVREGDAVYIPPDNKHQLINDSDDWVQHIAVTARVGPD